MTRERRWLAACIVAGLVLRLAFALGYWVHQPLTHDEREYLALARSIAHGDGMRYPADEPLEGTSVRFDRPPGYPAFLAAIGVTNRVNETPARVKVAQAMLGAIGVWLMALIAWRAGGSRAGLAAAAIAAVYPPLVWMPAYALSETLYSTLAIAAACLLDEVAVGAGQGRAIAAGAFLGAATLVRPAMLLVVPSAALWLVMRRERARAAVVAGVALLCIAPWTIRNALVMDRFVPVAAEGGVNFWIGNHPLSVGDGDLAANPDLKRAEIAFRQARPGLDAAALEPEYYRDALAHIAANPLWWLGLEARKVFYTIVPIGPSYRLHSTKYFVASGVSYLIVLPCAIAGVWRLRRRPPRPAALWLMAGASIAAGLIFFPQERYRIPVVDPALIVSAAALAAPIAHERAGRRSDV